MLTTYRLHFIIGEQDKVSRMIIDGVEYEVRELTMEQGFAILKDGEMDVPSLIRASVLVDGEPAKEGEISMRIAQKLMPEVLRVNDLEGREPGND